MPIHFEVPDGQPCLGYTFITADVLPSSNFNFVQGMISSEDIKYNTMKSMDRAAKLAMLPDGEAQCVDLWDVRRVHAI